MSLRDSLDLIRMVRPEAGTSAIEREIVAERASSLRSAETRVIAAMAALAGADSDRQQSLDTARQAVWAYFVQRELIGFRGHNDVIRELKITPAVLAGLGAAPSRR